MTKNHPRTVRATVATESTLMKSPTTHRRCSELVGPNVERAPRMAAKKYGKKAGAKVKRAMHEKKEGSLKSGKGGKGGKVTSRKQAIAIGLSEARKEGANVPKKRGGAKKKSRGGSKKKSGGGAKKKTSGSKKKRSTSKKKSRASKKS